MSFLEKKIEAVMTSDDGKPFGTFWEAVLYFLSLIYGVVVTVRALLYEKGWLKRRRLSCVVVSIGNLTVGGTGKTPLAIYVARVLRQRGYRVAIATRGYKGEHEHHGGIVSDGKSLCMGPDEAGDEACLMAGNLPGVPVLAGKRRFLSGLQAMREFGTEVLVLDDGFQHMALYRDLDLVLFDACFPVGNGHLVPRGPLREPLRHASRGHALVATRCGRVGEATFKERIQRLPQGRPVFFCNHVTDTLMENEGTLAPGPFQKVKPLGLETVRGKKVLAFSGIGNNKNFLATVHNLGCEVMAFLPYPDHHRYRPSDISRIESLAERLKVDCILTTEKDYVRLDTTQWRSRILSVNIRVEFTDGGTDFREYLTARVAAAMDNRDHDGI